jgi:hypothetical protein
VQLTPGKAAQSTAFRNVQQVDCSDVVTKEKGTEDADEETGSKSSKSSKPSKPSKDKATKDTSSKGSSSKGKSAAHGKR